MRRDRKLPPFISNQLPLATRSTAAVKVQTEDDESEWRSQSSPWWHPMELKWKSFHAWTLTSFKSWDVHLTRLIYYYRNHKILMILVKGKDSWLWVHFCFIFKIKALKYNCLSRLGPRNISNLPFLGQLSELKFSFVFVIKKIQKCETVQISSRGHRGKNLKKFKKKWNYQSLRYWIQF